MNYYKRHLGDYAKKAGRLSMLQHGAFTLLIDACYDREQFPTTEEAIDWTWASSTAEVEAVEFVLRKFFTLEDGRYVQKRIQEEIAEYHEKASTNARIAQEREAKRKESSTTRARSVNEASPNHKPLTINQEDTPIPPAKTPGAVTGKSAAVSLPTWLTTIKAMGEQPMPETDPVFDYAEQAGIPMEFMRLCWVEFRDRYSQPNAKRYKDWRAVYRKAVRANWFRLWRSTPEGYMLTTEGQQAQRAFDAKQAVAA